MATGEQIRVESCCHHCVYTKQLEGEMIVVLVWVDDIIVPPGDMVLLSEVKEMLQGIFHMKNLGRLSHFLGTEKGKGLWRWTRENICIKFWKRFEMTNYCI